VVQFIDRLLGTRMLLGVLMGIDGPSERERQELSEVAADEVVVALGQRN
jgi:hypothetical protein